MTTFHFDPGCLRNETAPFGAPFLRNRPPEPPEVDGQLVTASVYKRMFTAFANKERAATVAAQVVYTFAHLREPAVGKGPSVDSPL